MAKYKDLCGHVCIHRYEAQLYVVKVGERGFPIQSLWALAGRLWLGPRTRDSYVHDMYEAAEATLM